MWKLRPQGSHPTMGTKLRALDSQCISIHSKHGSRPTHSAPHQAAGCIGSRHTTKGCENLLYWPFLWGNFTALLVPFVIALQPCGLSLFNRFTCCSRGLEHSLVPQPPAFNSGITSSGTFPAHPSPHPGLVPQVLRSYKFTTFLSWTLPQFLRTGLIV